MAITLMPLPYPEDALQPHISADTLRTHHGKHHKTYVDKVNAAIEGTPLADRDLEAIVLEASKQGDTKLFNNAAQAWNHGFYWHSLTPEKTAPDAGLGDAITRDFGSLKDLNEALSIAAVDHFGSGWAWLVVTGGKLKVTSTHDAGTPLTEAAIPLLTIDVWEHAYYLDVRNKRPDYVKSVIDNCLNWTFASRNFDAHAVWNYPQPVVAE